MSNAECGDHCSTCRILRGRIERLNADMHGERKRRQAAEAELAEIRQQLEAARQGNRVLLELLRQPAQTEHRRGVLRTLLLGNR